MSDSSANQNLPSLSEALAPARTEVERVVVVKKWSLGYPEMETEYCPGMSELNTAVPLPSVEPVAVSVPCNETETPATPAPAALTLTVI